MRITFWLVIYALVATGCRADDSKPGPTTEPPPATVIDTSPCEGRPVTIDEVKWDNGKVKRRREVITTDDGRVVFHGNQMTYYEDGQKKMSMTYVCGTPHGKRTSWYPDGSIWTEGVYRFGKDHGTWTVRYREGNKRQEYTLVDGIWQGTHTRWHQNGQEAMKVHYVDGLRQGWLIEWDDRGNLTNQVEFADGLIQPTPRL